MAYYAPCLNCAVPRDQCQRLKEVKEAIAGLSITSIKFRCRDRRARFYPGQRIEFDWQVYDEADAEYGGGEGCPVSFKGTVVREKTNRRRFVIRVDQDQQCDEYRPSDVFKDSEFISVRPDDMRPVNEPDRSLCERCSAYLDDPDDCTSKCHDMSALIYASCEHRKSDFGRANPNTPITGEGEGR